MAKGIIKRIIEAIDTSVLTATADRVLRGYSFYGNGSDDAQTGTMTDNGAVSATITPSTSAQVYSVPQGYHNGSGRVNVSAINTQTKTVTPQMNQFTVTPDNGRYLSSVTVRPVYNQHKQIYATNSTGETLDIDLGGNYTALRVSVHIGGYRNSDQSASGTITVTHGASSYTGTTLGSTAISMGTSVTSDFDQIVYYPEVSTRYIRVARTGGRWHDAISVSVLYA